MTRLRFIVLVSLLALAFSFFPTGAAHAQGADVIKEYSIDIEPQEDGTMINTYGIEWCVISDAAGPLTWFTIGMPNETFDILSYSGDVSAVRPDTSGFDYLMRIDLSRSANAGDCVTANIRVHQFGMAYQYEETGEVFYQFTPGWFDEVPVERLQVTWSLPSDPALVKSIDPPPNTQTDSQAVWETKLGEGDRFTVSLFYDQAAFPAFNPNLTVTGSASGNQNLYDTYNDGSQNESTYPAEASSQEDSAAPGVGFFESISISICTCLIVILVIVVLIIIFSAMMGSTRSYRGGSTFGGYRGGGWSSGGNRPGGGSIFGSGGGSIGRSNRNGGGSGLFGGRGSSCACVSSGCACACAGGGRAGCSRKGFDVSGLFKNPKGS